MLNLSKENIIEFLQKNKPYISENYGVVSIGLMGSFARDEQTDESDIDVIVEFTEVNYHFLAGLCIFLEKNFNRKVDIIRKRDNMKKSLLDISNKEAIYA